MYEKRSAERKPSDLMELKPQYFGFILVISGWLIGWPTILTLVFAPILIYKYVGVCKIEEKEMSDVTDYKEYSARVPFFIWTVEKEEILPIIGVPS